MNTVEKKVKRRIIVEFVILDVEEVLGEARVFGGIGDGVQDFVGIFKIWR